MSRFITLVPRQRREAPKGTLLSDAISDTKLVDLQQLGEMRGGLPGGDTTPTTVVCLQTTTSSPPPVALRRKRRGCIGGRRRLQGPGWGRHAPEPAFSVPFERDNARAHTHAEHNIKPASAILSPTACLQLRSRAPHTRVFLSQ